MMTLYGLAQSRSTRALWVLEEASQSYTYVSLNFKQGEQRQHSFLQMNPAAKVPVLKHNDLVITESAAIVNYIATISNQSLIPTSSPELRAEYDRWCFFALSELEQGIWTLCKHKFALPKERRVPEVFETACWEYQQALSLLSQGLADKSYIIENSFSGADILIGHTLLWGERLGQHATEPNLNAYLKRIQARPALQAALSCEQA